MSHRTRSRWAGMAGMVAALAALAALAVAVGAGPATAGTGAGTASTPTPTPAAPTGWVVDNLNPDPPFYELESGSVTLADGASGSTISCQTSGGWGRALPRTIPQDGSIGENWGSIYDSCTGPGAEGLEVQSVYIWYGPTDYDAETDRVTGWASADLWALGLIWPDCEVDLYNVDPYTHVRMTYDNRSRTLTFGPITASVDRTSGAGCAGRPQVGDVLTFETALGVAAPGFTVRPA